MHNYSVVAKHLLGLGKIALQLATYLLSDIWNINNANLINALAVISGKFL